MSNKITTVERAWEMVYTKLMNTPCHHFKVKYDNFSGRTYYIWGDFIISHQSICSSETGAKSYGYISTTRVEALYNKIRDDLWHEANDKKESGFIEHVNKILKDELKSK